MTKRRKTGYSISAVAAMFHVHPQTLRLYEREGLLKPSRSRGNTRLYVDEDLKRLEVILNLTRDLKVNLAGVDVILGMRERMGVLRQELAALLGYVQARLGQEDAATERLRTALVLSPPRKILRLRSVRD